MKYSISRRKCSLKAGIQTGALLIIGGTALAICRVFSSATGPSPATGIGMETRGNGSWYILNEPGTCGDLAPVYLMIVVCSGVENHERRSAIRRTWGLLAAGDPLVRLAFLLGKSADGRVQRAVRNESSAHRDIVQGDFVDSYDNLTLKSVEMLRWFTDFCSGADFVLKTDDDTFVHVPNVVGALKQQTAGEFILGLLFDGSAPIRSSGSKWYVSEKEYPGKFFPKYCSGSAYALSAGVAARLRHQSYHVTLFRMEDVYITGILAEPLKIKHISSDRFLLWPDSAVDFRHVCTVHRVSVSKTFKIYNFLTCKHNCTYSKP